MKTNSTFKFLRNLLLLVVGVLGFAVMGFSQFSKNGNVATITIHNGYTLTSADCAQIDENTTIRFNEKWGGSVDMSCVTDCKEIDWNNQNPNVTVGTLTVHGNFTMSQTCTITGSINVEGNLIISQQQCGITGTVTVSGNVTLGANATIGTLKFASGNHSCTELSSLYESRARLL